MSLQLSQNTFPHFLNIRLRGLFIVLYNPVYVGFLKCQENFTFLAKRAINMKQREYLVSKPLHQFCNLGVDQTEM
jgi:hypothetical protein